MSLTDNTAVLEGSSAFEAETDQGHTARHGNCYERMAGAVLQRPEWIHFGSDEKVIGLLNRSLILPEGGTADRPNQSKTLICSPELNTLAHQAVYSFDRDHETWDDLRQCFGFDSLQMVSLSMEEEAMQLSGRCGDYRPEYANGPYQTASSPGKLASLLFFRYKSSRRPLAMLCVNADEAKAAEIRDLVLSFACQWDKDGYVTSSFVHWLKTSISWPYACTRQTENGPVLVIQDDFPNGHPSFGQSVRLVKK
ncbi:MAG: hypothetical protein HUJ54_05035 [Erysipelotrichaceae bacterium]|nr:hypothetical protein [Erysipelotrichaceae bacterium]